MRKTLAVIVMCCYLLGGVLSDASAQGIIAITGEYFGSYRQSYGADFFISHMQYDASEPEDIIYPIPLVVASMGGMSIECVQRNIYIDEFYRKSWAYPVLKGSSVDREFYEMVVEDIFATAGATAEEVHEDARENEYNVISRCVFDAWFLNDRYVQVVTQYYDAGNRGSGAGAVPGIRTYLFDCQEGQLVRANELFDAELLTVVQVLSGIVDVITDGIDPKMPFSSDTPQENIRILLDDGSFFVDEKGLHLLMNYALCYSVDGQWQYNALTLPWDMIPVEILAKTFAPKIDNENRPKLTIQQAQASAVERIGREAAVIGSTTYGEVMAVLQADDNTYFDILGRVALDHYSSVWNNTIESSYKAITDPFEEVYNVFVDDLTVTYAESIKKALASTATSPFSQDEWMHIWELVTGVSDMMEMGAEGSTLIGDILVKSQVSQALGEAAGATGDVLSILETVYVCYLTYGDKAAEALLLAKTVADNIALLDQLIERAGTQESRQAYQQVRAEFIQAAYAEHPAVSTLMATLLKEGARITSTSMNIALGIGSQAALVAIQNAKNSDGLFIGLDATSYSATRFLKAYQGYAVGAGVGKLLTIDAAAIIDAREALYYKHLAKIFAGNELQNSMRDGDSSVFVLSQIYTSIVTDGLSLSSSYLITYGNSLIGRFQGGDGEHFANISKQSIAATEAMVRLMQRKSDYAAETLRQSL